MELKWKLHMMNFKWRVDTGTRIIMDVNRGTLVRYIAVRVGEIFTNISALTIGDEDDATKFGTVTYASATLQNMTGEYLTTKHTTGPNANGMLYTASNDIRATLTADGTPDAGEAIVYVIYAQIE